MSLVLEWDYAYMLVQIDPVYLTCMHAIDRINWLYKHRDKIKGLRFVYEPPVLRFFLGKLEAIDNWGRTLSNTFIEELGSY